MTALEDALSVLGALVLEDGRRWGEAAVPAQWEDASAVLDPTSATPYHFLTRARGYSKTSDLAGIALAAMLCQLPAGARLYGVAADRDQGRLLVDALAGYAARTPEIGAAVDVAAFKATTRSGAVLEVLAADAPGAYGLRPAFLIVDEIAQHASTPQPRQLFEATTSALAKVPGARMVVLTSAGDPAHWSHKILEHAYRDPLWRVHELAGPPPWADRDRLDEQRRRLPESSYQRLFENVWTAAEDRLTNAEDLAACVSLHGPLAYREGRRYVIGLDLGLKHDRTVAVLAHSEQVAGIDGGEDQTRVVVDRLQSWQGTRAEPVQIAEVEGWVKQAVDGYSPCRVVADPWQAVGLCQRLRRAGVRVEEYTFSSSSVARLASTLYLLIRGHQLALPNDEQLLDELRNVRLRETSPGVLRMDHDPDKRDDAAVALALAATKLLEKPLSREIPDCDSDAFVVWQPSTFSPLMSL